MISEPEEKLCVLNDRVTGGTQNPKVKRTFPKMPDAFQILCLAIIILSSVAVTEAEYEVGVGIADCTGPAAEIVFMGYAKSKQKGCGIHLRQFSRAFVFDDGKRRAAFVTVDAAMMAHGVRREVLLRLSNIYGAIYSVNNLILSGTHTHGAPGGFLMDLMLDIPSYGFVKETFDALVRGITDSIIRAHKNMVEAKVYVASGELLEANINRSPASYLLNPEEERAKYKYNVDKDMVQIKIVRSSDNSLIGAISWFAVHPTSMNNTNCLITSDNLGYASVLLEKYVNRDALVGKGSFVGAFASTNLGDVSPNIKGPRCVDTGNKCDTISSTCEGHAQFCIASGPGKDMFESTKIIARRLFEKAKELLEREQSSEISGPLKHVHQFADMPKQSAVVSAPDGTKKKVQGCLPAMGYSFAAGTTDGPGEFDFSQGTLTTNAFWDTIRDFIFPPTPEDVACQHPKPILINTGRISYPYEWQSKIVSLQLIQIGDVVLIAVPGEFTTMSGRRLRNAVKEAVIQNGGPNKTIPIITGLSNVYTSYIATPEEYQLQRYEGASTIYGPHTLTLYLSLYGKLAASMTSDQPVDPGPTPPDFSSKLVSLATPVLFDTSGWRKKFGDCTKQPPNRVDRGTVLTVKFTAGHPRNDVMHEKTFLAVEKLISDRSWTVIATDADWNTKFIWKRSSYLPGSSEAIIEWDIPRDVPTGTYRIRHFGHYKYILGGIYPYEGVTNSFEVA